MKFTKYDNLESFGTDTLEVLLENEVQNNLPVSFIYNEQKRDTSDWLLATVKDEAGGIVLTAACTPPFNIVMYETGNKPNDAAIRLLSDEIKSMGVTLPGVLAEQGLARRFAEAHVGAGGFHRNMSMNIMRLDKVNEIEKAPGLCRPLREDDLFYVPYWERAFGEDCKIEVNSIQENIERLRKRLGKDTHLIWEDGYPVSQAANERNTQNGGGVGWVYTPPHYRGKGYATAVVAKLSQDLLDRGNKFCFLFADAENPVSCGIYRKMGYYDLCVFDGINFENEYTQPPALRATPPRGQVILKGDNEMKYHIIDAFADKRFSGNPAGVCLLEEWLPEDILQNIAMENNLSETAFLVKRDGCYDLRWFTPTHEVDLCGHATLASAFMLFDETEKLTDILKFKTKSGILTVRKRDDLYELDFPSREPEPIEVTAQMERAVRASVLEAHISTRDLLLLLKDERQVLRAIPDFEELKKLAKHGIIITAKGENTDFVSRFFAPNMGVPEDPVTGSAHTVLIPFWSKRLGKQKLIAQQLSKRGGNLFCENCGERVKISGKAVRYLRGEIIL